MKMMKVMPILVIAGICLMPRQANAVTALVTMITPADGGTITVNAEKEFAATCRFTKDANDPTADIKLDGYVEFNDDTAGEGPITDTGTLTDTEEVSTVRQYLTPTEKGTWDFSLLGYDKAPADTDWTLDANDIDRGRIVDAFDE